MAQGVPFLRDYGQGVVDVNVVAVLRPGKSDAWHCTQGVSQELGVALGADVERVDVLELQQADGGLEVGHPTDRGFGMATVSSSSSPTVESMSARPQHSCSRSTG